MNKIIEELYDKIDAQDKIINTQSLEIAKLKEDLKDACCVIEKIKKEKQQAIEYIKNHILPYYDESTHADFINLLEILGEK